MAFDKVIDSVKLESEITATANAIRAKTGETSKIQWEENTGFATAVEAITTGGGSSEDVRYVTFMNNDGTVELGKKAVAVGDDCADPIARGVFDTPTKESTAQYNYTHDYWSTVPNGGTDANALKAVTEDRTVYATFISVLRYYTITFYDSDGTTVLTTKTVAYGSVPSYTPTKSGFDFVGWEPNLTAVTGETSYTAKWTEEVSFATASWARIAEISASGEAPNYFKVGDTKTVSFNFSGTTENIPVRIIGFNHDDLADGSGKAGISIAMTKLTNTKLGEVIENTAYGTGYIWKTSATRTLLNSGAAYTAIPSDLRSVIKQVTKTSNAGFSANYGGLAKNTLYTTDDKVWLLSSTELGLDNAYSSSDVALGQGEVYEYYATDGATRRKMATLNGTTKWYPTRSMYTKYANSCVCVNGYDGGAKSSPLGLANSNDGAAKMFGFCV